jgi:CubicO group peptidase (beta-lactamase class C family)
LLPAIGSALAQAVPLGESALRAAVQHYVDECPARSGAPGVTAAVALPSGEVLQFAAGLSDVENGFAMQPDDRMAAGSIGKSFVGAFAAALVTEGVVKLDDPIEKYLGREPWFKEIPYGKNGLGQPHAKTTVFQAFQGHVWTTVDAKIPLNCFHIAARRPR